MRFNMCIVLFLNFCGCSSVVERHVANVNVVGSNLITRSFGGVKYSLLTGESMQVRSFRLFQGSPLLYFSGF
jgi:hypothetical protein